MAIDPIVDWDCIFVGEPKRESLARIQDVLLEYLVLGSGMFVCMHSRTDFEDLDSNFGLLVCLLQEQRCSFDFDWVDFWRNY